MYFVKDVYIYFMVRINKFGGSTANINPMATIIPWLIFDREVIIK